MLAVSGDSSFGMGLGYELGGRVSIPGRGQRSTSISSIQPRPRKLPILSIFTYQWAYSYINIIRKVLLELYRVDVKCADRIGE
jgi:hypothetical protein